MTELFAAIIVLMSTLFTLAAWLVGIGLVIAVPAAVVAFIISQVTE